MFFSSLFTHILEYFSHRNVKMTVILTLWPQGQGSKTQYMYVDKCSFGAITRQKYTSHKFLLIKNTYWGAKDSKSADHKLFNVIYLEKIKTCNHFCAKLFAWRQITKIGLVSYGQDVGFHPFKKNSHRMTK